LTTSIKVSSVSMETQSLEKVQLRHCSYNQSQASTCAHTHTHTHTHRHTHSHMPTLSLSLSGCQGSVTQHCCWPLERGESGEVGGNEVNSYWKNTEKKGVCLCVYAWVFEIS